MNSERMGIWGRETPINRGGFLRSAAASVAISDCACGDRRTRPNILWLIAEDLTNDLSCYGNAETRTPIIDRLAAEGVRFQRAYTTAPVCSALRSAIATGLYQTRIGAHHHRSHRHDNCHIPEGVHHLTEHLGRAGYHTSNFINVDPGVLNRPERESLMDKTIIFFFGDNGRDLPRGKMFLHEGGIRVPLIIRVPERFRVPVLAPGSVRDDLVSAVDIAAPTLGLAGVNLPQIDGVDFLDTSSPKREYLFTARDRNDDTVDRVGSVITRRFKYIRNFFPDRPYTQPNAGQDTANPSLSVMRGLFGHGKLCPEQARFMARTRPPEELYYLAGRSPRIPQSGWSARVRSNAHQPARRFESLDRSDL